MMRDITPTLFVGTMEEAKAATFSVTYAQSAVMAARIITSGGTAMVPDVAMAKEILQLIGTEDSQIDYLLSGHPGYAGI